MKFTNQRTQFEKIIMQRNGYMVLALGNILLSVMFGVILFSIIGKERVVIVPPNIGKSFWVSAQQVSPEYLDEMTAFFANLRLNITPVSASRQRETILRYTDPTYYNTLKSLLVQVLRPAQFNT